MAQARFELTRLAHSRLAIGSQVLWQDLTQVTFFGEGAGSVEDTRSEDRIKSTDVVGYTTVRPMQRLSIDGRLGWLQRPTIMPSGGTFKRGHPDTLSVFADDVVVALPEQPRYVHGEASITSDTRNFPSRPTNGAVYRAAWATYSDRDTGAFSFRRYEAEAAQFVPLAAGRVVLALHAWTVGSGTDTGRLVPFYLMPSLGGSNTLRGYADFRFHDRNLAVISAESRLALMTHIDFAAFVDAGNVAPRMSELNFGKRSYGIGLPEESDSRDVRPTGDCVRWRRVAALLPNQRPVSSFETLAPDRGGAVRAVSTPNFRERPGMAHRSLLSSCAPALLAVYLPFCTPVITPTMPPGDAPLVEFVAAVQRTCRTAICSTGPWGAKRAPDPRDSYRAARGEAPRASIRGLTVRDSRGRKWSEKQAPPDGEIAEGPTEVVLSRVLSAVGYTTSHRSITCPRSRWSMTGVRTSSLADASGCTRRR